MVKKIIDIFPPERKEPQIKNKTAKTKPKKFFRSGLSLSPKIISILGIFLFAVLGLAAFFTLGRAEILVWPKTEIFNFDTKLKIGETAGEGIIKGELFFVEKEVSKEFLTEGKQLIEKKAEGIIRVYNNSSNVQTLIVNTRFQASLDKFQPALEGKEQPWFRSLERVVVSPKAYKDIRVAADSAGEKYNIKPSKFSIPGLAGTARYTLVYGESFGEFEGGLKKETAKVSASDINGAKNIVLKLAKEEILKELKNKIPAEFIFLEDGAKVEILEDFSSAKSGESVEKFIYQSKAKAEATAFKKTDLEKFIRDFFSARIPEGKEIDENSLSYEYSLYSLDPKSEEMTIFLKIASRIFSSFNKENAKENLLGRSQAESEVFLSGLPGIERSKVNLWPFWQKKVPKTLQKVKLEMRLD